ncbi:MAG: hypothetical protein KDB63_01745 [Nocardioidaceae bacterium]|jgi:hypothetical protein|nr:hypothetical protein [Nocardioidaceae bacterium]
MTEEEKQERFVVLRERLVARNAEGLVRLLSDRDDLRGVSALADQLGDRVLWCA